MMKKHQFKIHLYSILVALTLAGLVSLLIGDESVEELPIIPTNQAHQVELSLRAIDQSQASPGLKRVLYNAEVKVFLPITFIQSANESMIISLSRADYEQYYRQLVEHEWVILPEMIAAKTPRRYKGVTYEIHY